MARNKEHKKKYNKEYYIENTERFRNSRFINTYGITVEDYAELLLRQKGVCAICEMPEIRIIRGRLSRLSVDHNHTIGKVRGLLCHTCNTTLGRLEKIGPEKYVEYLSGE